MLNTPVSDGWLYPAQTPTPSGKGKQRKPKDMDGVLRGRLSCWRPASVMPQSAQAEGTWGALPAGPEAGTEGRMNKLSGAGLTVWVVLLTHGLCSTLAVAVLFAVVLLLAQVLLGRACGDVTRHSGQGHSGRDRLAHLVQQQRHAKQPCPWEEHTEEHPNTNPPSPINPAAQTLWNRNNNHLSLQPKTPAPWASRCSLGPHCTYRPSILAHARDRHHGPRGADHWLFTMGWSRPRPYLAGRVGRAPWAAAPSCCSLGHPGPSWQWAPGPGNAGSRPVRSCSGTWLPAGASWRLCDRTETPK